MDGKEHQAFTLKAWRCWMIVIRTTTWGKGQGRKSGFISQVDLDVGFHKFVFRFLEIISEHNTGEKVNESIWISGIQKRSFNCVNKGYLVVPLNIYMATSLLQNNISDQLTSLAKGTQPVDSSVTKGSRNWVEHMSLMCRGSHYLAPNVTLPKSPLPPVDRRWFSAALPKKRLWLLHFYVFSSLLFICES